MNNIEVFVGIQSVTSGMLFNAYGLEGCPGVISMEEVHDSWYYLIAYRGVVTPEWYKKHYKSNRSITIKKI